MSGGSLNYFYNELEYHVGDFKDKELDDLIRDLSKLFKEREWYLSGDTNQGNWVEARDAFKKKWFKGDGREERLKQYVNEIRDEMLDSLGLMENYCKNCKNWTPEGKDGSPYGQCAFEKHCLMHRSESCEKFEKKDE